MNPFVRQLVGENELDLQPPERNGFALQQETPSASRFEAIQSVFETKAWLLANLALRLSHKQKNSEAAVLQCWSPIDARRLLPRCVDSRMFFRL